MREPSLAAQLISETIGTGILVFLGVGSVHVAVLTGALVGVWQVASVWGAAVALAVYATGAVSGGHINPAMTLAFAAFRGFPLRKVPLYILAQLAGAVLAAALLYFLFGDLLRHFEQTAGIVRGTPGSEASAMLFGEYFPNPSLARGLSWPVNMISLPVAMLAEGTGTALLAFAVFAFTDHRNRAAPHRMLVPLCIGLTLAGLISVFAPLTQAGFNPARDFGPRLVAWLAGWGEVAIPGPRGGFSTVYILAPVLGALLGGAGYTFLIAPQHAEEIEDGHR